MSVNSKRHNVICVNGGATLLRPVGIVERNLLIEIKESQGDKLTLLRNKRRTRHQGSRTHCLLLDRKEVSQFEYQYW